MLRKFFWQGVRTGILAFVQGLLDTAWASNHLKEQSMNIDTDIKHKLKLIPI